MSPRRGRSSASPLVLALLLVAGPGTVSGADPADVVPSRDQAAHLAAMKARVDEPPTLTPMTIAALFALARPPRAYTRAQLADIIALESRGVTVIGFVARVDPKRDGDFHIQITAQPPHRCLRHTTSDQLITELTLSSRSVGPPTHSKPSTDPASKPPQMPNVNAANQNDTQKVA